MGDDKGKGRARYEGEPEASQQNGSSQGSMFSRIAASASGLTRSSLATPSSNELNERASAALANAGKGQSSSQGASSAWAETSIRPEQYAQNVSQHGNGFRLGHEEEHVRTAENEFRSFLDATESFTPSQSVAEPSLENPSMGNSWGEAWARSQHFDESLELEPQQISNGRTITEQESHDGDEVLALLSGPLENENLEDPVAESEEIDWNLTAEQMAQLRAMTKDLFPPPNSHKSIPSDHPLNLIPEFGASNIMRLPQTEANGEESYMYTGLNRETFREQWEGVLTRYADEVWGGLLPLIKEARHEVEQMSSAEPSTEEPQALRRLRAILAHVKQ